MPYFQQMLEMPLSLKSTSLEERAAEALKALLNQVPAIELIKVEHEPPGPDRGIDIVAHVSVSGRRHTLVCEAKSSGQPRHVRMGLLQLRDYVAHLGIEATPVFIAPYLSPDVQALCRGRGVGFLDFEGNARLVFGSVFIQRSVATKPPAERRDIKSLFNPKSAQLLRVMLKEPGRAWRVVDLAKAADVSLGHVSNVRTALLNREWAKLSPDGFSLTKPDTVLDAWRSDYEQPDGPRLRFYTTLHGNAFDSALRTALRRAAPGRAMLGSFSAAQWLAPYGRTGTQFLYADDAGLDRLQGALKLSSTLKGENVVVTLPKDHGLFRDAVEPAPGIICTDAVQTYLDLTIAGERGQEAADHLRRERLAWPR